MVITDQTVLWQDDLKGAWLSVIPLALLGSLDSILYCGAIREEKEVLQANREGRMSPKSFQKDSSQGYAWS